MVVPLGHLYVSVVKMRRIISSFRSTQSATPTPTEPVALASASSHGLILLAEGTDPIVDIVAVHGLNGHRETTWRGSNNILWLRDLLPLDLPNARVYSWGYDANTHSSSRVSCQFLYDHAQALVSELCLERETTKTSKRPIIFIAHSLGGIIVKSALIHSDLARQGALLKHRSIKISTYGIFFMGTPHQGGSGVAMGKVLVNVASVFIKANDRLLRHLERDSEWLQQQLQQYGSISADFVTKFAYEEYATPTALGHSILVVPKASAVVPGAADAEPIAIHADHINMVRFKSKLDTGYRAISRHIILMTEEAKLAIARRWEREARSLASDQGVEHFLIPFSLRGIPLVKEFVPRDAELQKIEDSLLSSHDSKPRQKVFALHGLGGVGKTQLAVQFARKHQSSFSAVVWVNGSGKDQVMLSMAKIAERLPQDQILETTKQYLKGEKKDIELVVKDVLSWFSRPNNTRWLLLFDNVDRDPKVSPSDSQAFDVKQFFPEADHGSILITTRILRLRQIGQDMRLGTVDKSQGTALLRNELGHEPEGLQDVFEIVQGLPLALAQAGSYMRKTNTSPKEYIKLYELKWSALMQKEHNAAREEYQVADKNQNHERSVWTTWSVTIECIRSKRADVVKLLKLWALLDNQDVWYELFADILLVQPKAAPAWLERCVVDELEFKECMRLLMSFSMVNSRIDASSYSMHSVLHRWCLYLIDDNDRRSLEQLVLIVIASATPEESNAQQPRIQRRIIPHCERGSYWSGLNADANMEDIHITDDVWWALGRIATVFMDQRHMAKAEKMYLRALSGKEKSWGPDHISTLDTVHNLGLLYSNLGRIEEAEKMYLRALSGKEKSWGPDHTSTLDTVNNLGLLYNNLGRNEEAEKMYLRALSGKEKSWGRDHTSTLDTVNNLGNLYKDLGRNEEAEKMYLRALSGYEKLWGPDHASTLATVNNLGALYNNLGRNEEAEKMYLRALSGKEKSWGPDHTSTLDTVNNLGNLYNNLGRNEEAEKMYLRALSGYEKSWGSDHASTLNTVNNLGLLYSNLGRSEEAEKMYLRALSGYKKSWGPDHTSTLATVNNLGLLYWDLGRNEEAEKMYLRALSGYEKSWGPDHTSTLDTVNNLGNLYNNLGRNEEAEKMYLRALSGKEKSWGPDHASTLNTVNNLGLLYSNLGRNEEAEKMYLRALSGKEKSWGSDHASTLNTVNNLGLLYSNLGRSEEAEKMYLRALSGYEKSWGPDHTTTLGTVNNLGNLYWDLGRDKDAEKMYLRVISGYEKSWKIKHKDIFDTRYNLALLYRSTHRSKEARLQFQIVVRGYSLLLGDSHSETVDALNQLSKCSL